MNLRTLAPALSLFLIATSAGLRADYQDVMDFFDDLNDGTIFPVQGRGLADVESAFGPRVQTSGGNYDWHRGIDIDGVADTDLVVAPLGGYLHRYGWESSAAGYTTILRHELSDFGVASLSLGGKTITRFYTWYSHLSDDGVDGNNAGTGDLYMDAYAEGDAIAKGATIGILGSSGAPANGGTYGPHLHFELRVGSNASLQFQLENPGTTQWGFDPHFNPMVLFDPTTFAPGAAAGYQQSLAQVPPPVENGEVRLRYTINTDRLPLLNHIEVGIYDTATNLPVKTHTLDYNQRTGYDASTTALLDTRDTTLPFVDPVGFGDGATEFQSDLVVPAAWMAGFENPGYELRTVATDVYGSSTMLDVAMVPEPATVSLLLASLVAIAVASRIRREGRA